MSKYILKIAVVAIFIFTAHQAFSQNLDLIWLEVDNTDSTIFFSQHKNNRWSAKQSLATGSEVKLTPAIASHANKHVAVWVTSSESGKLSLVYSTKPGRKWRTPQPVRFNFQETTAPVLISFSNQFFLFFAANSNDDDDIYMSTFENNGWSDPIMVHPDNSVPDLLPEPRIINGALTLVWQQFDGDRYIYRSQELLSPGMGYNKQAKGKLSFQLQSPGKVAQNALQTTNTKILKTKFNVNLPSDFKGVGLSKAYAQGDQEMPVLHIHSELN